MTMGRLDRFISALSPSWAARRVEARARIAAAQSNLESLVALSTFEAAERSRTTSDWNPRLLSNDQAVIADQATIISRARAAARDDWAAASGADAHVRHIVGIGITARANARDPRNGKVLEDFNRRADRVWYEWANDPRLCHTERHWTFADMEALAVREQVITGSAFALLNYTPRVNAVGVHIQLFEFEQLCTWIIKNPETGFWIRNGIEIDDYGAPVAYWVFTKGHPLEYIQGRMAYDRIPAERVIQYMRPQRVRQTHGVSRYAPVLKEMWHTKLLSEYTLLRARQEAVSGASIESSTDASADDPAAIAASGLGGGAGVGSGTFAGNLSTDARGREINLEPLMVVPLPPGRTMKFHSPTTPGSAYDPFTRGQSRKIAAGIGLDYQTLTRDFSGNTFAGQRQGLVETWAETDPDQQRLITIWCNPMRRLVISTAIMEGRLEAPRFDDPDWREAYLSAQWRGPAKPWISPADEAAAAKMRLDYKLTTRGALLNEQNEDARDVLRQYADEVAFARAQTPPVDLPDAQPNPKISPREPRPGAQTDRERIPQGGVPDEP